MPRLAILVPIADAVFTAAWIVLGAVTPGYELFGRRIAPYSWVSQPVSGLGLGPTGPWMNAAFIGCGALVLIGVLSTAPHWRSPLARAALVLIAAQGLGMAACGVFTLESMMLHLAGFLLAVPLPAVGLVLAAVALRGCAPWPAVAAAVGGVLSLVLFGVFMATFDPTGAGGNTGSSGLVQRLLILVAMGAVATVVIGVARAGAVRRPGTADAEPTASVGADGYGAGA